jgi:hypothetical protein
MQSVSDKGGKESIAICWRHQKANQYHPGMVAVSPT